MPSILGKSITNAKAQLVSEAMGLRLNLGRNATVDEIESWVYKIIRDIVRDNENRKKQDSLTPDTFNF